MKILYVLNATAARGGATKSFLALADAMADAGHEIAVIVPDENGITPALRKRGWNVLRIPYAYDALPRLSFGIRDAIRFIPRAVRDRLLNVKARKKAIGFAREWRPDLVHDNTSVTDIGHYVAESLDVPHVIHVREYGWQDFKLVILGLKKRLGWRRAYGIAITSRLAEMRGKYMPEGRMVTVYNGIVKEVPSEYPLDKKPYFLYAGRILRSKGVNDLADSYIRYAKAEINQCRTPLTLKLAGEGVGDGFAETVRRRFLEAGLDEFVEWLGSIDNVSDYYTYAAATIIPSVNEGFGRVLPEAIAAGCLCVVRDSAGLAEQLENGRKMTGNEIALSFKTTDQLTSLLTTVGKELRGGNAFRAGGRFKRMIDDGRITVERLYTHGAYARAVKEVYSRALGEQMKKD